MSMELKQVMESWAKQPKAKELLEKEWLPLQRYLEGLRGQSLLCFSEIFHEKISEVPQLKDYWFYLNNFGFEQSDRAIVGENEELPFLSDSLDNLLAPHILDFQSSPKHLLREMWRVLAPNGKLIISGFNSYSLFGLPSFLKQYDESKYILSGSLLRKNLVSQGFHIELFKTFCFGPQTINGKDFFFAKFIETLGSLAWPNMGCLYFIVAVKPILGATPKQIRGRKLKYARPSGLAEPTTLGQRNERK